MIIEMARVRIAGPRALLDPALRLLQDLGDLHLITPDAPDRRGAPGEGPSPRLLKHARRMLDDLDHVLAALPAGAAAGAPAPARPLSLPPMARRLRGWRRELDGFARMRAELLEEQALLLQYRTFFEAFDPLLRRPPRWPDARASFVLLRAGAAASLGELERKLQAAAGSQVELHARQLPSGETAVLLLAAGSAAAPVETLLAAARLDELPAPRSLGEPDLLRAMPALRARMDEIETRLRANEARRVEIAGQARPELDVLQLQLHDLLLLAEAEAQVRIGELLFVVEGWMPGPAVAPLRARMARELGPDLVVSTVSTEPWTRGDAPVALANPRLFRPFELVTRAFPLPRYGSIDPTPFVAIFFPMFFGLMMGDVGYGVLLALAAGIVRRRSRPGGNARAAAEMALGCALFAIAFGVLFGEFFGTLGAAFGMRPLAFDRENALAPFLIFTIALGAVHIVLGLVLAIIGAWRQGERRKAAGRGLTIAMIVLTALALLAAFEVLPSRFFTPAAIAVLIAFPVLIALEGIIAVIELMSAFGHILSYARIMALGTASLMLAMIANRMVGALGSAVVGMAFALLFHLVNFAIGLFSPTIHALRLHYVEFFGEFYSPGGATYRPLAHWRAASRAASA